MHCRRRDLDPSIYLLVEHLDAALAAGEQLTSLSLEVTEPTARTGPRMLRNREARFATFVNRARSIEASLVAHILQARRRASEVPRVRGPARMPLDLFSSGTTVLLDAVAEYGDPAELAFNSGADRLAYLRARHVVPPDAGVLLPAAMIEISDDFLVAGRLQLGPLLDLIETFLRALNTQYELWTEGEALDDEDIADEIVDDVEPMLPRPPALAPPPPILRTLELDLAEQIALARMSLGAASATKPAEPAATAPTTKPPALPGSRPGSLIQALKNIEQLRPRSN